MRQSTRRKLLRSKSKKLISKVMTATFTVLSLLFSLQPDIP
jgi:hypothetical protein